MREIYHDCPHSQVGGLVRYLIALAASLLLAADSPFDRPMPPAQGEIRLIKASGGLFTPGSLAFAIQQAEPGDVIELGTGTYVGSVTVAGHSGLTIRAAPGGRPVLTTREPVPDWAPIEGAPGQYRVPRVLGAQIYRASGVRVMVAKDRAHFDSLVGRGIAAALRGTDTILFLEGADPRAEALVVSRDDRPAIACDRAAGLKLEGLRILVAGQQGVDLRDCDDAELDGLTIFGANVGVRAKNGTSDRVAVRRSWIVDHPDPRWTYRDVKGNAAMEGSGLAIPGDHIVAEENVIEGVFNGVTVACPAGECRTVAPRIVRNLFRDIGDDAFELDGPVDGAEVARNRVLRAFVVFSVAPRMGEGVLHFDHNAAQATFTYPPEPDGTLIRPSVTKFNGAAARDLLFERNTLVGEGDVARGAPSGSGNQYPVRVRWLANQLESRTGPLVRHTGAPAEGNLFEHNCYRLQEPTANAFQNWALPLGQTSAHVSLEAARSSVAGKAAGWEREGVQSADPLVPTAYCGAFEPAAVRIDRVEELPTGWMLVRGAGFTPDGAGLPKGAIVVSSDTAFARAAQRPGRVGDLRIED